MPISNNILAGSGQSSADLGDPIDQSLRFRNGTQQTLTGTSTIPVDDTYTLSFWYKHTHNTSAYRGLLFQDSIGGGYLSFNAQNSTYSGIEVFNGSQYVLYPPASIGTFRQLRDPSAWFHCVITQVNSTSFTIYINNEQAYQTTSYQFDWTNFRLGSTNTTHYSCDGYIADLHHVDGTALTPTSFGKYNDAGVWVPQTYSGTYGTNGFHLTFDSSQTNGIGHDSSGNNKHFTASNFDTAAISSSNFDNDIDYFDTPTSNYAVINVIGSTNQTAVEANLQSRASGGTADPDPPGLTVYKIPSDGDFYFECITNYGIDNNYGYWATGFFVDTEDIDHSTYTNNSLWTGGIGFSVELASNNYNNNANLGSSAQQDITTDGSTFSSAICGVRIKNNQITITRNGAATNVTNTTFSKLASTGDGFYRIYTYNYYGSTDPNGWTRWNFGQRPYVHAPSGVTPEANGIQTNNLPEPTIKNGSEHCRVLTGTGANIFGIATGTNTNGTNWNSEVNTGFTDGLYWIKDVSVANEWQVIDTVRGTSNVLQCPTNANETTYTAPSNTSIAYCWKGGGTAVSNTNGSITSSVSANTDAGFSIATYTGTGAAATVGHGLTEAPDFIITRARNNSGFYWTFYHSGMGNGYGYMNYDLAYQLNAAMYQGTSNTTWTYDSNSNVNGNGTNYVSYLWHSVPGYSKFGTFEGNANSDGPFVYLGFRPSLLLLKNGDGANQWKWINTTRSVQNSDSMATLSPQTTSYEALGYGIDLLSNGFKLRDTSGDINASGTMIYCAWAESPFGGKNAPPATAR